MAAVVVGDDFPAEALEGFVGMGALRLMITLGVSRKGKVGLGSYVANTHME